MNADDVEKKNVAVFIRVVCQSCPPECKTTTIQVTDDKGGQRAWSNLNGALGNLG